MLKIPNQAAAQRATQYRAAAAARDWMRGNRHAHMYGKEVEQIVTWQFGWVMWDVIDLNWRRVVSGSRALDRGVDAVGPNDGVLVQVKYFGVPTTIGHDPVARLHNIASHCRHALSLPAEPGCTICAAPPGTKIGDVPNAARTSHIVFAPADVDQWAADVIAAEAMIAGAPADAGAPDYSFQAAAVAAMISAPGPTVRARLPPAAGKSRIIAALAAHHAGAYVVVAAPRLLIVDQLHALVSQYQPAGLVKTGRVVSCPAGARVFVASAQSLHALPRLPWSVVIRDEAHIRDGHKWVSALPRDTRVYELSATLAGEACYTMSPEQLVARGGACAPEFVFAVHGGEPTMADIAAHLLAHPEYRCVLACFQSQKSAKCFVIACQDAGVSAASCLSQDESEGDAALADFRAASLRVLAVVGRVEMGVDVHCCDTVLFAEPWESDARTLQLIGRGMRLHPSKAGRFTVLTPVAVGAARDRRLRQYVECVAACGFGVSGSAVGVTRLVPVPDGAGDAPGAAFAGEAADLEERFDMHGREVEMAVDALFAELVRKTDRYADARAALAALGDRRPRDAADYAAFRGGLAASDPRLAALPANPATEFEFDGVLRSWGDLLGADTGAGPGPIDCAAVTAVLGALGVSTIAEAGPGPALYAEMRYARAELPPRVDADWPAYFGALEVALMAAQK